jgi:ubiquinone/menaquinone biosynthesis C-methylase UbiE
VYSGKPGNPLEYTARLDREYSRYAGLYDRAVKLLPLWKTWIKKVLPHIEGKRVLEVSFGTGYLMTQYADRFETFGIDYNPRMVEITGKNLRSKRLKAALVQASVEALPFPDGRFDSIVNTMAFTGYPDGEKAVSEFFRVLKTGGKLLLVDFNYPSDRNIMGYALTRLMERSGDIMKDISGILRELPFDCTEKEIGGFGSVHLYVAVKRG